MPWVILQMWFISESLKTKPRSPLDDKLITNEIGSKVQFSYLSGIIIRRVMTFIDIYQMNMMRIWNYLHNTVYAMC